jgi:hypothetical protein
MAELKSLNNHISMMKDNYMSPDELHEKWILIYGLIKKLNLENSNIYEKALEIHNIKYRKFTDEEFKDSKYTMKQMTQKNTLHYSRDPKTSLYTIVKL